MREKGQVSLEFLIITAFAFLLVIPVMLLFLTEAKYINEDITAVQVNKLSEELVDAVNNVYYLGEPTTKTIRIYVPKYVQNVTLLNNQIIFVIDTGSASYAVTKFVASNVTGNLNSNPGLHSIVISAEGNSVRIEG